MNNVQFSEERAPSYRPPVAPPSGFTGMVIRMGLAKDIPGAQRVLFIAIAIAVLTALVIFFWSGPSSKRTDPVPRDFREGESVLRP